MIDGALLKRIDSIPVSPRQQALKERYLNAESHICSERPKLVMESYKETEGDYIELRRARALKKVLEGIPIGIQPEELTVGSVTPFLRGCHPYVDWDAPYLQEVVHEETERGRIVEVGSPARLGLASDKDYVALMEAVAYFRGKTPADRSRAILKDLWGDWYQDTIDAGVIQDGYYRNPHLPGVVDWQKGLQKGMRGIIQDCQAAIQKFTETGDSDPEKIYFWQAVIIACEGVISFARRYAQLAREQALVEENEVRRAELEEIARTCDWVPENPAGTLREAIQSIRLLSIALTLENGRKASDLGRLDQYLYPYFKKDIAQGQLTLEQAAELIGELISHYGRFERVKPRLSTEGGQDAAMINHITLGGTTKEGEDAINELTYLILHVLGLLRYAEPHATIRSHPGQPRWLLLKALETNRKVAGCPAYENDEHVINYMVQRGVPLEIARDWAIIGCSQPETPIQRTYKANHLNVASAVELALHDGIPPMTGKRIGPATGDPRDFKTFDEMYDAFKKQWDFVVRRELRADRVVDAVEEQWWRAPLHSALYDGCIKNGKSHMSGGFDAYPAFLKKDRCIVDAAESLSAIKKLVFDDKKLTMAELIDALDSNFEGEGGEEIRQMCLAVPKYGNDIDEPDNMVRDVAKFSASTIFSEKNRFGYPYASSRNGLAFHITFGKRMGALPNGRKAREPLVDGSLSPMQGMDKSGPTAVLNSVLKADFKESLVGVLNMKFPAPLFQNPETLDKLASLTQTFMNAGGTHIQYNILDKQTLLDAQKHPEKHKDLIVRVAGFSAYFINLTREVQDDIIRRTEQVL